MNRASAPDSSPAAERERLILLECRLDQLRSQLEAARAEADHARTKLAESAAREADHARRQSLLHAEVAEARAELATLHQSLERAEALRAELEGSLLDAGPRGDARELIQLRRDLLSERQRARVTESSLARLRVRVDELLASRETLFARLAEWQELVREDGFEAADLSEYLSELRREVMTLEHRNDVGEKREATLRERLVQAGLDPDGDAFQRAANPAVRPRDVSGIVVPGKVVSDAVLADVGGDDSEVPDAEVPGAHPPAPTAAAPDAAASVRDPLLAALQEGNVLALRTELTRRIGRTEPGELAAALRPGTESPNPAVRAAAYEALGRVLEADAPALEATLRAGLADADSRVRRRVVLAAATARGVALRPLLEPLGGDPDSQVQRVVREVLRHVPRTVGAPPALTETGS